MIDFATLKGVTIPEGNVTQITDASGAVLWKAAPSGANVKVTLENSGTFASMTSSNYAYFTLDGVRHAVAEELVVPIGTVITFGLTKPTGGSVTAGIYLNGAQVAYNTNDRYSASYVYTVTGDIEVKLCNGMTMSGGAGGMSQTFTAKIYITEL